MKTLSPLGKKKKSVGNFLFFWLRSDYFGKRGLSNMIAYVLLISITVSLSVLVYGWLRFYVAEDPIEECSDNVNIIIREYSCFLPTGDVAGNITVNLKNKGLFTVDGYELRVHDRVDASFGIYFLDGNGTSIVPGAEYVETYFFNSTEFELLNPKKGELDNITLIEIQPFMTDAGNVRCKSHATQEVICNVP